MNLRMDDKEVRFRITPSELDELLSGREVESSLRIGGHRFGYCISPDGGGDDMTLGMAVGGFSLRVPRNALERLQGLGRSKDGISIMQDGITISLQVDIKLQLRKAA